MSKKIKKISFFNSEEQVLSHLFQPEPTFVKEELIPNDLDKPIAYFQQMNDEEFNSFVDKLRSHFVQIWETTHNPIFGSNFSSYEIATNLKQFVDYVPDQVLEVHDGINYLKSANKFTTSINHFFPEMYNVPVGNLKATSLIDQLYNPSEFKKKWYRLLIQNSLNIDSSKKLSQVLKSYHTIDGNQVVYNFPITIAKYIYTATLSNPKWHDKDEIYIGDTSMGWGGRLAGLLGSLSNSKFRRKIIFYGSDVNTAIQGRYQKLIEYWEAKINPINHLDFNFNLIGAEALHKTKFFRELQGKFHLFFTSPPYFNKERYSNDPEQSYIKYPTYFQWKNKFLKSMLRNIYDLLTDGGEAWINVADIKQGNTIYSIEKDLQSIAKELGFKLKTIYRMKMGIVVGSRRKEEIYSQKQVVINDATYKWEPIFVFEK